MIERFLLIFTTLIIDILCICMVYFFNSKFMREELKFPKTLGIICGLGYILVGILTSLVAIYSY